MIVQLIHNPASRSHRPARLDVLARAFAACGATVVAGQTEMDGSLVIAPEADLICVSGGDGALRLVITALVKSDLNIPICVFPSGTVNLVAREIGYSRDPEKFAQEVMAGFAAGKASRMTAPVAASDGNPFVACLSAGPDSLAVAAHSPALKKRVGGLAYAVSAIRLLVRWPRQDFVLSVKNERAETTTVSCGAFYIAKSHHYAGPWTVAPASSLESGVFHLVTLGKVGRWNYLKFVIYLALRRDPAQLGGANHHAVRAVSVDQAAGEKGAVAFQVDGDLMPYQPKTIRMTGGAVEYCLPKKL